MKKIKGWHNKVTHTFCDSCGKLISPGKEERIYIEVKTYDFCEPCAKLLHEDFKKRWLFEAELKRQHDLPNQPKILLPKP